ncbi:hypothetical protein MGSAQ_001506 [marine sediment metagenome]|uniref:Uncharacterized protein n=1 Tax=marine sediment metagenome TaxID=412755 RepID=A0A1B6NU68_9ZZZZ
MHIIQHSMGDTIQTVLIDSKPSPLPSLAPFNATI